MIMEVPSLLQKLKFTSACVRLASTNTKYKLKDYVEKSIINEEIKPRKQPGIITNKNATLPNWIIQAIKQNLKEKDKNYIFKESTKLTNYLFSRQLPSENAEIQEKFINIEQKVLQLENKQEDLTDEEIVKLRKSIKGQVLHKLKCHIYGWKPIEFDNMNSLIYTVARCAPEYSALTTIFNEIKSRDGEFNPKTIFDFGSGVGTVLWAAMQNWNSINEYMGIDISNEMHDLAEKILNESTLKIKGVFRREYLPLSNIKYDLIVSAYSLMELPNMRQRLEVISKLWKKTTKYLVIVEQGTNNGFRVMNEAREFINYINTQFKEKYYIFAPCPHSNTCPKYFEGKIPCNFVSQYLSLPVSEPSKNKLELFSYIVFKKGEPTENDSWCRVVKTSIIRKNHVQCTVCTPNGKLESLGFRKKNDKVLYQCARNTGWGDRLPIEANNKLEKPIDEQENLSSNLLDKEQHEER